VALRSGRETSCGCRGGISAAFAGRKVGQTQFPGMAQRSARRKKQSLQVFSGRFAIPAVEDYRGVCPFLKGHLHQIDAISAKIFSAVVVSGN
jgi:hypothetical protein